MTDVNESNDNFIGSNFKFTVFKGEDDLKKILNQISCSKNDFLNEKLCVVSIIGKSDFQTNSCKAELIDEALGRNVFRGNFCEEKLFNDNILNEIEGYFDPKNKLIFLHLISPMDTEVMINILKKLDKEINEKGFLNIWNDLNMNTIKALLMLFLISHIVVVTNPSIQIDLSFLQIFRILDQLRIRTQTSIISLLKEINGLSKNWINLGRPCSPRVVFVFEAYNENKKLNFIKNHISNNKRKYELYLEDQLYRLLRKSRIITNICSNSLFAVCNQIDFVYISTKQSLIRDSNEFFTDLIYYYCGRGDEPVLSTNLCNELLSLDTTKKDNSNKESFFNFLWTHINTALNKGFDDNVGRHNIVPIFELPKIKIFFDVLLSLKSFFFKQVKDNTKFLKTIDNKIKTLIDTDYFFSEARCQKVLSVSLSYYKEKLPLNYTQELHEQKLAQTLQLFLSQARGKLSEKFAQQLKQECDYFWKNGHQVCGVLSLFKEDCMNPIHKVRLENEKSYSDDDNVSNDSSIKYMDHCSGITYISTCNCGRRQAKREDPFTIKQANFDFYENLNMKCNCNNLKFDFPIFGGSIESAKPTNSLLRRMMSMSINDEGDDEDEDDIDDECDDEEFSEEEAYEDESDNEKSDNVEPKIHTQLESESLNLSQTNLDKIIKNYKSSNKSKKENKNNNTVELENDEEIYEEEIHQISDEEDTVLSGEDIEDDNENRFLNQKNKNLINTNQKTQVKREYCKTEYLSGMLNSLSSSNLLPIFSSWSLVCLGPSSLYSHNVGIQDQPGFVTGTNFLLPWDVTVKLEHSGLLSLWLGKKPPGIKNRRILTNGTQFTVKIFIGVEYECLKGHRFMCSKPNTILKSQFGQVKETANQIALNDMPLYMPCVCKTKEKEELAQLMRIHIVTPKAPVQITLNPRVQPAPSPCPIYFPMKINKNNPEEMIKLTQSAYWILRLPFVYKQEIISTITKIHPRLTTTRTTGGRFLKGCYGIYEYFNSVNL